ncbi:MAG: MlaE family ABC transporter permease [Bacteroidota bacterium]|jgi:phospholipid/cholesterol/gamma-HCH transport system permease protein|nr:ABC transporter permease [Bacteroidota bacterium]
MNSFFYQFGRYLLLLKSTLVKPEKGKIYWRELARQMVEIGVGSLAIVIIISVFIGAVITVQTAYQLTTPLIPRSTIGSIVTNSSILEMAPTVTCLILAGKIGSNIASEIGTMRISEQIDALEIMGVNASAYLILPKIVASVVMIPILVIISGFLCVLSGIWVGQLTGVVTREEFIQGSIEYFIPFTVTFSLIKAFTFGFIISSVSAYYGFYTVGGALEVGKTATKAVVVCCVIILLADYLLAQLLL